MGSVVKKRFLAVSYNVFDTSLAGHVFRSTVDLMESFASIGYSTTYVLGENADVTGMSKENMEFLPLFSKDAFFKKHSVLERGWGKIIKHLFRNEGLTYEFINQDILCEVVSFLEKENLGENDIVYFPYISYKEISFILPILKSKNLLKSKMYFYQWSTAVGLFSALIIKCYLRKFQGKGYENVKVIGDTDRYVEWANKKLKGHMIGCVPMMNNIPNYQKREAKKGVFKIVFIGRATCDKGFFDLFGIIRRLERFCKISYEFVVQAGNAAAYSKISKEILRLKKLQNVRIIENNLSTEEYNNLLMKADIVIMPYKKPYYKWGTSGPFSEALSKGIPVCVVMDTWLSGRLVEFHNSILEQLYDNEINTNQQKKYTVVIVEGTQRKIISLKVMVDRKVRKLHVETGSLGKGQIVLFEEPNKVRIIGKKKKIKAYIKSINAIFFDRVKVIRAETSYDLFGMCYKKREMDNVLKIQMQNYEAVIEIYKKIMVLWNEKNGIGAMRDYLINK